MRLPVKLCVLLRTIPRIDHGWCPEKGCPLESTPVNHTHRSSRRGRRGLTLIEMLVSVTLTLMIVFALVSVFDLIGKRVTDGRALIELSGNLRGAANRLQQDLAGLTATTLPPRDPSHGEGYLEIVDGPTTDRQHYVVALDGTQTYVDLASNFVDPVGDGFVEGPVPFDTSVGDTDDVLAFTTRSQGEPFFGQISHASIRLKGMTVINASIPTRGPATNRLIPSALSRIVPLSPCCRQTWRSRSRRSGKAVSGTNLYAARLTTCPLAAPADS